MVNTMANRKPVRFGTTSLLFGNQSDTQNRQNREYAPTKKAVVQINDVNTFLSQFFNFFCLIKNMSCKESKNHHLSRKHKRSNRSIY